MGELVIDGQLVADQCGDKLDVSQNIYRKSPVASRLPALNGLEILHKGLRTELKVPEGAVINRSLAASC